MATPVWTTTAGKLASIDEQVSFSVQLEANTSDSTAITYSVIAGSLPSGMELTSTGLLTGIPAEVAKRTRYTFVIRATAGSQITDRTFYLDVEGADAPTFTTASGTLKLDDSTRVGVYWVLDGAEIGYQIEATDTDTRAGQTLAYEIIQGELPPGVTMSGTGYISGIVQLTEDEFAVPQGGYDNSQEAYDDVVYDKTVTTRSVNRNFDFIVRVSDGTSNITQNNSIQVYSADYWRVSSTSITIDMTEISDSPLTMDLSSSRRPVFTTDSDLGTFRHDNEVVIKIDVDDFDPLQGDLEYSIQSGSLPTGLSINVISGEISGTLPRQTAVTEDFTFTIRANRVVATGINVFTDKTFTMKVIGEIDIGIAFTTPGNVGTLTADIPSMLAIEAVAEEPNRVLNYTVTEGSLPTGITLSPQGNLIGTIDASDFSDSTTSFTFTVNVSDQYQSSATTKEFTLNVDIPFTTIEYGSMDGTSTSLIDQNIFYNIAQDPNINSPENIYRQEDANFGMKLRPEMLLIAGLEAQTLTTFQQQMEQNHSNKRLFFGDLKTAVAKENGVVKYEVVYIDMKDNLVNNAGESVSSSVTLRSQVAKPILGPRAGTTNITTDTNVYEITTDNGLAFSTAGSKVRFANQLSADLGFVSTVFPNAVANMRSRMKSLGHKEWTHLPLWMRTTQSGQQAPLGWQPAVVIAYCKPGFSELIKKRISDKNLNFKNIEFVIDKYQVSKSKITPTQFTGDGTTRSFVLNEIVHEEDILIKEGSNVVFVGEGVRADNQSDPTSLTADSQVRSADHEFGIDLTHDTDALKTTITFRKKPPTSGTIITVDRSNDKYLKFRSKGII
tara:strand:- start:2378 stop:4888 length:2511 start_codon:yes stop_codon:yes gene_type:complete